MFSKLYNPSKHLAIDEVIFLFKGRVVSKQYAKETQMFGIKIYNYEIPLNALKSVLGKGVTATHATVTDLTGKLGYGDKLYMNNFFSSFDLFDDLTKN
jgi:hypothetical protein